MWRILLSCVGLLCLGSSCAAEEPDDVHLEYAILHGSTDDLKRELARPVVLNRPNSGEQTPLSLACQYKSADKVRLLLQAGANPNARHPNRPTPLMMAIQYQKDPVPVVEALLESPDLNLELYNENFETALVVASRLHDPRAAQLLVAKGAKDTFFTAVCRGDVAACGRFLDAGTALDGFDAEGNTPLMLAARYGRTEVIRELVQRGADLNRASTFISTPPLFVAARHHQFAALDLLLELGANPNYLTRDEKTYLDQIPASHLGIKAFPPEQLAAHTKRVFEDPNSSAHLRASAYLALAIEAHTLAEKPGSDPEYLKQAESYYRRAIKNSTIRTAGTTAIWRLYNMLLSQDRKPEAVSVLNKVIVRDIYQPSPNPNSKPTLIWRPHFDTRHRACDELADLLIKMHRNKEALVYARFAIGEFHYRSSCGMRDSHRERLRHRVLKLEHSLLPGNIAALP